MRKDHGLAGCTINTKAEGLIKSALKKMPGMDRACIKVCEKGVQAEYVKGIKTYRLPDFMSVYGCCTCFKAIDGAFCKHQLLALWVKFLGSGEVSEEKSAIFLRSCIELLGTRFGGKIGCSQDSIEPSIARLEGAFLCTSACVEVAPAIAEESPAIVQAGTLMSHSAPAVAPAPDAEALPPKARFPARLQLSPGSNLSQLGPEKGVQPVLSLLQHACDRDTPAHLHSRFASDFNAFIKQWQVAYEADAVASAEHVQALQKVSSPLTVHRAKSAGERHRRKKYPVPGVHSFTKTSKEVAAET
jgi:hypothetical protein